MFDVGFFLWGIGLICCQLHASVRRLSSPWLVLRNLDVSPTEMAARQVGGKIGTVEFAWYSGLHYSFYQIFLLIGDSLVSSVKSWAMGGCGLAAVTRNRQMSNLLGIPTDRVEQHYLGLGFWFGRCRGAAITLLGSVGSQPRTGGPLYRFLFMVIVLGGVWAICSGTLLASNHAGPSFNLWSVSGSI